MSKLASDNEPRMENVDRLSMETKFRVKEAVLDTFVDSLTLNLVRA